MARTVSTETRQDLLQAVRERYRADLKWHSNELGKPRANDALLLLIKVAKKKTTASPKKELTTKEARLAFIRKAQIWAPTHVSEMDLRAGPQDAGAFQPNAAVTCDYVEKKTLPGTTQKFDCAIGEGDVAKVRYGATNGKVQGAVLATRLLWALGFGADRLYPVRVTCRGCSSDP